MLRIPVGRNERPEPQTPAVNRSSGDFLFDIFPMSGLRNVFGFTYIFYSEIGISLTDLIDSYRNLI